MYKLRFFSNKTGSMADSIFHLVIVFEIASIVLYFWGPIDWISRNNPLLFFTVSLYIVSLALGYRFGAKKWTPINNVKVTENTFINQHFYIVFSIVFIVKVLMLIRIIKMYGWSDPAYIIISIFTNYRNLYFANKIQTTSSALFGGRFFSIVEVFLSPLCLAFIPLTISSFREFNLIKKILSILTLSLILLCNIAQGTTEGFFEFAIYITCGFLFRNKTSKDSKSSTGNNTKTFIIIISLFIVIIVLFGSIMDNRMNGLTTFSTLGRNRVTESGWIYDHMPMAFKNLLVYMDVYLCQGYYGMSLAMTIDWQPTFFMGSSRWFCEEMSSLFPSIYNRLYTYRIEQYGLGWSDMVNWHSCYTWFANDVHWIGVVIIMFVLGYIFALAVRDANHSYNLIAICVVMLLLEMFLFLPCNNIVFAKGGSFISFYVFVIAWLLQRKRIKFRFG